MTNNLSLSDTPIEVQGYKTDPVRRGYQILWNYESTFWAALVGNNEAWRLYEVLRSFCHEKTPTCSPSINLLLAILTVKDRTVLTGRIKKTRDKDYKYPGLIDMLQTHGLVIAEVSGAGPEMRYTFHVNLTPGLLTAEQVGQLPPVLQQKHRELLERCQQAKQELEAKKKPSRFQLSREEGVGNSPGGVLEIPIPPLGNSKTNNTHLTIPLKQQQAPQAENQSNPGRRFEPAQNVVVALTELGITKKVAQTLASNHPEEAIYKQMDFHAFEMATTPHKIKSPSGRLRTRIEENWAPADSYTSDWRERLASEQAEAEQIRQARAVLTASVMTEEGAKRQEQEQHRQAQLAAVKRQYGTSETHEKIWSQVKSELLSQVGEVEYKTFIAGSELLAADDRQALIWVSHSFTAKTIEKRYGSTLKQRLAQQLNLNPADLVIQWIYPPSGNGAKAYQPKNEAIVMI